MLPPPADLPWFWYTYQAELSALCWCSDCMMTSAAPTHTCIYPPLCSNPDQMVPTLGILCWLLQNGLVTFPRDSVIPHAYLYHYADNTALKIYDSLKLGMHFFHYFPSCLNNTQHIVKYDIGDTPISRFGNWDIPVPCYGKSKIHKVLVDSKYLILSHF